MINDRKFSRLFHLLYTTTNITKILITLTLTLGFILLTHMFSVNWELNLILNILLLMYFSYIGFLIAKVINAIIDLYLFVIFKHYSNIYCTPAHTIKLINQYFKDEE